MNQILQADVVIVGAGIAGLWLHHRLNDMGLYTLLLEKTAIGSGQTLSSQGIIHGGTKYTLNGSLSNAASAIANMPPRWLDCLNGSGEIDLSHTETLSRHQLMWSTQNLSSKLTSFFSSKLLKGKVNALNKNHYPTPFKHKQFKGLLYELNEPVLNVTSLVNDLCSKWHHRIIKSNQDTVFSISNDQTHIQLTDNLCLSAKHIVLTGGEGNESLLTQLGFSQPKMQRRPLQMVLAKAPQLPKLYAHCIGASTKPIATITTHQHSDNEWIWYIGGNIAENGVDESDESLITQTQKTLHSLLPWVDLSNAQWATHCVNRAEPAQSNLLRPDTAFVESIGNVHIAWPTKLALTPDLADRVLARLDSQHSTVEITKNDQLLSSLITEPCPIAFSPWEKYFNAHS